MPRNPWRLAECTWADVRSTPYEVAVLPWGATEAHNTHLPYATDTIETDAMADRAAAIAWDKGARILVLPCVPFGVNTGQRDVPFCLNMMPSTQAAMIRDLLPSLQNHGVRKLVILNGHGGNDFKQIIRELQPTTTLLLAQVNWYQVVKPADHFAQPGDHAGELETSVTMHLRPDLVRPLSSAGAGSVRTNRISAFREGWAWMPRPWTQVTEDTGVGDPAQATGEKGAAYLHAVTDRLASFLLELSNAEPNELYV
jgi:creatinine amidohydrolase